MKLIERVSYLNKLKDVMETPDIKVITGIRRSGKSKLMEAFIDYLKDNIKNANIIHINFNLAEFADITECHLLNEYISNRYDNKKRNFVFIDEVQMCKDFEKVINWLHASEKYDIYITGSNAFLLSSDLATLFTGRTFEIEVYPFSFKEFITYYDSLDINEAFKRYLLQGGLSGSYVYKKDKDKYDYISEVYDTLIIRDIKQKYRIKYVSLLNKLSEFLLDNISNLSSSKKITSVFQNDNEHVDRKTVAKYIECLCNAFAFYKFRRYDVRGKHYLATNEKYYLSDHAIRYAKLGTKRLDYGRMLENIVAIELKRRGYEVYVGVLYKKEIDFVAKKRSEQIYIQVSYNIDDKDTFKREIAPLLSIRDAYPKMIITVMNHDSYTYEGVQIVNAISWLTLKWLKIIMEQKLPKTNQIKKSIEVEVFFNMNLLELIEVVKAKTFYIK